MTIRPATAADIPTMRALEARAATAGHWDEEVYRRLFTAASPQVALVVEDGGLKGFLVAAKSGPEWEIENLVIAQNVRRRGLGSALVRDFLALARQSGGEAVFLEVRASNAGARALYEKWGFAESGRRRNYYQFPLEDAVLYRRPLDPPTPT